MLTKIIGYIFFFCLLVAIPLSLAGVQKIELGNDYYTFIATVARNAEAVNFEIPNIPMIPETTGFAGATILNVLVQFVNFLSNILNFVIQVLNFIIKLFIFLFYLFKELFSFIDRLKESSNSVTTAQVLNVVF